MTLDGLDPGTDILGRTSLTLARRFFIKYPMTVIILLVIHIVRILLISAEKVRVSRLEYES